jgi:hypothetical protein
MSATDILLSAGGSESKLYVDDVFSTYLYTGNGSTQTINNGIDLAGKGGMVWFKGRSLTLNHGFYDTNRGATFYLASNTTAAQTTVSTGLTSFNSNGFDIGAVSKLNNNGAPFTSWTFRKAPKFFDVVTYTGDGVAGRQIAHSLGQEVGMIVVKRTSGADNWAVYHRSLGGTKGLYLNLTNAEDVTALWNSTNPTASEFTVGTNTLVNASGATYVAYLFAHDPSADGIIQCGSFTYGADAYKTIDLGFEPQFLMVKRANGAGDWWVIDTARGYAAPTTDANGTGGNLQGLFANLSNAEGSWEYGGLTATGFRWASNFKADANTSYIYLAIRRPNKPPTSGTQVYNAIARTGTGAAATVTGVGFAPDSVIIRASRNQTNHTNWFDKLRGVTASSLQTNQSSAEIGSLLGVTSYNMDGINLDSWIGSNSNACINYFMRRAPGFFDIVAYTASGANYSLKTVEHGLGVVPEMQIVKSRTADGYGYWIVGHKDIGATSNLVLQNTGAKTANVFFGNSYPTSTQLQVQYELNTSGNNYIAYLFASIPNVSKVGSYTGNGTSQTINCGFSSGARFVLSKAVSTTGNWNIGDSTRGITAGSDPYLCLNTTAAEVTTDDWLDNESSGFIVNETSGAHANTNGVQYVFLAIA